MDRPLRHLPPLSPPPWSQSSVPGTPKRENTCTRKITSLANTNRTASSYILYWPLTKKKIVIKNLCSESLRHQYITKYLAVASYLHIARTCQISEIELKPTVRFYCICQDYRKYKCSNNNNFLLHDNIVLHLMQEITYWPQEYLEPYTCTLKRVVYCLSLVVYGTHTTSMFVAYWLRFSRISAVLGQQSWVPHCTC